MTDKDFGDIMTYKYVWVNYAIMKKESAVGEKKGGLFGRLSRRVLIALGILLAVIVILAGVVLGAFFAIKTAGRLSMEQRRDDNGNNTLFENDVLVYEGKKYRYNKNMSTILFVGVDTGKALAEKEEFCRKVAEVRSKENGTSFEYELEIFRKTYFENNPVVDDVGVGQSDVILAIAIDRTKKKASIISVDRNSMATYEAFDREGNSIGVSEGQLALSYSYGDGAHSSCRLTCDAVSSFLYDIPIDAYYSMKYFVIRELNDAVGGVEVTIPIDMTNADEAFTEGRTLRLSGEQAERFVSARQNVGDGSNAGRLDRQKQYVLAFIDSALSALKKDWGLPGRLYESVASNSCTDLSADEIVYLADLALNLDISYHSIDGVTEKTDHYDEFRPDAEALLELILDIFYVCED